MLRERRHRRAGDEPQLLAQFRFDLTSPAQRWAAISFLTSALVILLLVGIGSYRTFQASESTSFCGELCHSVMRPEWVAYHNSSHARVKCVECHIGAGANWFVRSKLSGLRQIWATTFNTFPRPIPTPIVNLRPARETCEECHWRRKFIGYKENVRSYFLGDEENTLHQLRLLVKIGGEKTAFMRGSGIHYHMLIASHVEYIAADSRRQEIAWVRVTRADGSVTEYRNQDFPLTEEELAELEVRTMDCMDCHNRPAHQFPTPMDSVNQALAERTISVDLPYIKREAVIALDNGYPTTTEAITGIANSIRRFYRKEYPEIVDKRRSELEESIREVQRIYRRTVFPEMRAGWFAYPNNIGHRDSPGCFRCHNDSMESEDDETIFVTCSKCHLILAQGDSIDQVNVNFEEGLAFVHPEDYEEMSEFELCTDCHTGGADVYE
jgi:nitrate/TMAO reductase-like tetraheme cytochrome c subunit